MFGLNFLAAGDPVDLSGVTGGISAFLDDYGTTIATAGGALVGIGLVVSLVTWIVRRARVR